MYLSCKFLMYPVLKIMHILNLLDTFSVGVTMHGFILSFSATKAMESELLTKPSIDSLVCVGLNEGVGIIRKGPVDE